MFPSSLYMNQGYLMNGINSLSPYTNLQNMLINNGQGSYNSIPYYTMPILNRISGYGEYPMNANLIYGSYPSINRYPIGSGISSLVGVRKV
uniref:Uncharacterized protein n=1 Tax=Parastrongyloides trichosuri TaxID=131310 RepID=A0A0N4Z8X6_PARTI